jgi:membrane protein required for colicin V production
MASLGLSSFDAVVLFITAVAMVMGFMTGLLRSLATILGYIAAAPVAVMTTPLVSKLLAEHAGAPQIQQGFLFFGVFVIIGIMLAALLKAAVNAAIGPNVSAPDRLAGAILGAVRIGLVAVVVVLVFDRIIPHHLEPDFIANSRLRPYLSKAGQTGLKSLPPEIDTYIDRLKRERGL